MLNNLTENELRLLALVIKKRNPRLHYLVDRVISGNKLIPEQCEALRSVIADEFVQELDKDYEPNSRGLELDALIGALSKVSFECDTDVDEELIERIVNGEVREM